MEASPKIGISGESGLWLCLHGRVRLHAQKKTIGSGMADSDGLDMRLPPQATLSTDRACDNESCI